MDIEKVVEKIVQEVISKLEEKKTEEFRNEILFAGEKRDDLIIKYSDFLDDWKGIDFIKDGCMVEDYKIIIVPSLSLNNLIDISFAREADEISSLVIKSFLNGLDVIVLEEGLEYRKYKESSNEKFYKYIESIERRLETFGLEFISVVKLKDRLKAYRNEKLSGPSKEIINKKLITKKDVTDLIELGETTILINKNTIVTALARDYIEENEMELVIVN